MRRVSGDDSSYIGSNSRKRRPEELAIDERDRRGERRKEEEEEEGKRHRRRTSHSSSSSRDELRSRRSESPRHDRRRDYKDERNDRKKKRRREKEKKDRKRDKKSRRDKHRRKKSQKDDQPIVVEDTLLSSIPPEVFQYILSFLGKREAARSCSLVNSRWRYLVCDRWKRIKPPANHFRSSMQLIVSLVSLSKWCPNLRGLYFHLFCHPGVLGDLVMDTLPTNLQELSFQSCAIGDSQLLHLFSPSHEKPSNYRYRQQHPQHPQQQQPHSRFPHLKYLNLSGTLVTDAGLALLPRGIQRLLLTSCRYVTDELFECECMKDLVELDVSLTRVTGRNVLKLPRTLKKLNLANNDLTNLPSLRDLDGLEGLNIATKNKGIPKALLRLLPSNLKELQLGVIDFRSTNHRSTQRVDDDEDHSLWLPDSLEKLTLHDESGVLPQIMGTAVKWVRFEFDFFLQVPFDFSFYNNVKKMQMQNSHGAEVLPLGLTELVFRRSLYTGFIARMRQMPELQTLRMIDLDIQPFVPSEFPGPWFMSTLTAVIFKRVPWLNDTHVLALLDKLPGLKTLRLKGCDAVTESVMEVVRAKGIRTETMRMKIQGEKEKEQERETRKKEEEERKKKEKERAAREEQEEQEEERRKKDEKWKGLSGLVRYDKIPTVIRRDMLPIPFGLPKEEEEKFPFRDAKYRWL